MEKKRHGCRLEVSESEIYEAKYYNGELVMIIMRRLSDLKIYSIKYLDMDRILHDNGELSYFRHSCLRNSFDENGKLDYSLIIDGLFPYCAKYDGDGKCTLFRGLDEY